MYVCTKPLYRGHFAKPIGALYTLTYTHMHIIAFFPWVLGCWMKFLEALRGLCTHIGFSLFSYIYVGAS